MIIRLTGEVFFQDTLCILPHRPVQAVLGSRSDPNKIISRSLPVLGWRGHRLGFHESDHGRFEVEAISDPEDRVQLVLLSHCHSFYESGTPEDAERRAYHQGVINSDLGGQREFSWGEAFCRLDRHANQDWLIVAYDPGPHVPIHVKKTLWQLTGADRGPSRKTEAD
jgi:hypothetical protein